MSDVIIKIPEPADRNAVKGDAEAVEVISADETGVDAEHPSAEDRVKQLEIELSDLRKATVQANERATSAGNEAVKRENERVAAEKTSFELRKTSVSTSLAQSREAASFLEAEAAKLLEAGDYIGASKKNREISRLEAKISEFERHDEVLKTTPEPKAKPVDTPRGDVVDQYVEKAGLLPKEAAWVRENKDVLTDPRKNRALQAAATLAETKGIERGSDKYFDFIETQLDMKPTHAASKPKSAPAAPVSAPVSRGVSPSKVRVQLTSNQRDTAVQMGMTPERYAEIVNIMSQPGYSGPRFAT